ncbi:MAG: hypothetical protein R2764_20995 [Bacteroidales bacterium]
MKKKNFVAILMVMFAIVVSSNLFAQSDTSGQDVQSANNTTVEGGGIVDRTSADVNGVFVPD